VDAGDKRYRTTLDCTDWGRWCAKFHDIPIIVVGLARECRMRAAEARARADEMKEAEPKAIMLRIAVDYEELAEWAEKNSIPWWDKNEVSK
jgi:hypothetical protein